MAAPLPPESSAAPLPDTSNQTALGLYYGVDDQAQDFAAARHIAWQERAAVPTHPGGFHGFSGSLVLAMIYANGLGAPRNPVLALRMGCEATAYPNNLQSADLDFLQATLRAPGAQFDICAAGSPEEHNEQLCDSLLYLRNRKRVRDSVAALAANWTLQQKTALTALEAAQDKFAASSSAWEAPALTLDTSPDGGPDRFHSFLIVSENSFLSAVQDLLAHPPAPVSVPPSDAELNRNYRTLMDRLRAPGRELPPTIVLNPVQERGIERDWIACRDAWVDLVSALDGPEKAPAWRARLTGERSATLARLVNLYGPPDTSAAPWLAACNQARRVPLPPGIAKNPVQPEGDACASYKPYYGIGGPVDFASARACAIAERNKINFDRNGNVDPDTPGADIRGEISGVIVLTMLYANGDGVPRNPALAQRFACEAMENGQIVSAEAPDTPSADTFNELLAKISSPAPTSTCAAT